MFPTIKRTVAVLTVVAAMLGAGMVASTANAEEPTPPNVEVAFTKVTDGTGFGTADQCWLNSATATPTARTATNRVTTPQTTAWCAPATMGNTRWT